MQRQVPIMHLASIDYQFFIGRQLVLTQNIESAQVVFGIVVPEAVNDIVTSYAVQMEQLEGILYEANQVKEEIEGLVALMESEQQKILYYELGAHWVYTTRVNFMFHLQSLITETVKLGDDADYKLPANELELQTWGSRTRAVTAIRGFHWDYNHFYWCFQDVVSWMRAGGEEQQDDEEELFH